MSEKVEPQLVYPEIVLTPGNRKRVDYILRQADPANASDATKEQFMALAQGAIDRAKRPDSNGLAEEIRLAIQDHAFSVISVLAEVLAWTIQEEAVASVDGAPDVAFVLNPRAKS